MDIATLPALFEHLNPILLQNRAIISKIATNGSNRLLKFPDNPNLIQSTDNKVKTNLKTLTTQK